MMGEIGDPVVLICLESTDAQATEAERPIAEWQSRFAEYGVWIAQAENRSYVRVGSTTEVR